MNKIVEEFYCFNCGHKLVEVGLGFLECKECGNEFLPTMNEDKTEQTLILIHQSND